MSMTFERVMRDLETEHLIHPSVEAEPTFLFNHVLMQETAYQSLLVRDRRDLHLQIANTVERQYADRLDEHAQTLAYHYWRGEDWRRAADYARRAGAHALRTYALREAIGYYTQALQALDRAGAASDEEICDVILGWAEAAYGFEPYPKQLELLARAEAAARRTGDKRRLALILHSIGKVQIAAGYAMRATQPLVECFTLATELGDEKLSVIPTFYMGVATYDTDPHRSLGWFDRAADLARKYGDIDIEAYALSFKAMVEARLGKVDDSRRNMEQAFGLVPSIKSPMCDSDVHLYSAWAFQDLGDIRHGLEYAKLGVQKAVSADNLQCACIAYACLGFGHLRADQTEEAVQAFEEAIRRSKYSGAEPAEILGHLGLGMVGFFSGRPDAITEIENALAHAQRIGEEYISSVLMMTLGEFYLQRGQVEMSRTYLDKALDYYRRHRMRPYMARALELLANALDQEGEHAQAEQARAERTGLVQAQTRPA